MTDPQAARLVLAALARTPAGGEATLVGSSGLFGFSTAVPALTEDIDVALPEALVAAHGEQIVAALACQGLAHEPGTATFTAPDGLSFDLLGWGDPALGDHIADGGALQVMVYADLSLILSHGGAEPLAGGGRALTPAGFCAAKLLTERGAKGAKDKLQALLVIAERPAQEPFAVELTRFLTAAGRERREELAAAAQEALLALARDPAFRDAGAEGYAAALPRIERGLEALHALLDRCG